MSFVDSGIALEKGGGSIDSAMLQVPRLRGVPFSERKACSLASDLLSDQTKGTGNM